MEIDIIKLFNALYLFFYIKIDDGYLLKDKILQIKHILII